MGSFTGHFTWGVATAAAQIEGATHQDGRTDSIWDVFARRTGAVADGDTPSAACDHYHRFREDVALMRDLGVDAYRFSVSWSRVLRPDGSTNPKGMDFYSRLVDELLLAGIEPWLTLYHWDLPDFLQQRGGWAVRETARRFRDYSVSVFEALGDRVGSWTTFNEPFCSALLGHAAGVHAPGTTDPRVAVAAVHHQHLAHGLALDALRDRGAHRVGITLNLTTALPLDADDRDDRRAALDVDTVQNTLFLDPLLRGGYPARAHELLDSFGLERLIGDGDLEVIGQRLDFLGVNYYHDDCVSGRDLPSATATPHGGSTSGGSPWIGAGPIRFAYRDLPTTAMGWEVNPEGLYTLLTRLTAEYPTLPPLYLTENGAAFDDDVDASGEVNDEERARYILDHIDEAERAARAGVDLRGYFVWSLLDNFEWAFGYSKRFGVLRVDFDTMQRTPKLSSRAYAARIRTARGR